MSAQPFKDSGIVKRSLLRDQVAASVKDAILRGEWKAGEVLPSQAKLAETYSVSVAIVREAIQSLEAQGLLNVIHGRGSVVLPPDFSHALEMLKMTAGRRTMPLMYFWEMRSFLEPNIAALAAERATPEQLQLLEASTAQIGRADLDTDTRSRVDLDFHKTLAEATANPVLALTIQVFAALYLQSLEATSLQNPTAPADHAAILQAVRARDSSAARAAMNGHLEHVKQDLLAVESVPLQRPDGKKR